MTDHYATLVIPRDAETHTIVRAWREAASLYHPDRPTGDAEKFRAAREAFNVLMDRDARVRHDATLNGAAAPGLISEDDFNVMKDDESLGALKPAGPCLMCGGSAEVRVAAAGFWTRRKCPACVP